MLLCKYKDVQLLYKQRKVSFIMDNVNKYPYLVNNEDNQNLLKKKDKCDKYDYITAIACGAIGGAVFGFCT